MQAPPKAGETDTRTSESTRTPEGTRALGPPPACTTDRTLLAPPALAGGTPLGPQSADNAGSPLLTPGRAPQARVPPFWCTPRPTSGPSPGLSPPVEPLPSPPPTLSPHRAAPKAPLRAGPRPARAPGTPETPGPSPAPAARAGGPAHGRAGALTAHALPERGAFRARDRLAGRGGVKEAIVIG